MVIRMHFDGKVFIPEEPVDLPQNKVLDFEIMQVSEKTEWNPQKAKAAVRRIAARSKSVGISSETLRRENIYEDRGA